MKNRIDFIEKLMHNPEFDPFNYKFNVEILEKSNLKLKAQNICDSFLTGIIPTIKILACFNKQAMTELEDLLKQSNIKTEELINLYIANVNKFFTCNIKKAIANIPEYSERFENISKLSAETIQQCEGLISGINLFIPYLKFYKKREVYNPEKPSDISLFNKINYFVQLLYLYKDFYEKILFEQLIVESKLLPYIITASISDDKYSLSSSINEIRQQKYNLQYNMVMHKNDDFKKFLLSKNINKIKPRKIKKFNVQNYTVDYEIEEVTDISNILDEYYELICKVMPFYDYMYNEEQFFSIINDYLIIYSKFQEFFNLLYESFDDSNLNNSENFKHIPTRIKKEKLKKYMLEVTNFDEKIIDEFLTSLESNSSINFFKHPLLPDEEYYLFFLQCCTENIMINNIDEWLEIKGIDIQMRGKIFEKFVKSKIDKSLQEKGYKYLISQKSKFTIDANSMEEIDLIIEFESIVMLGECKSLKYPIENRDFYNSKNRILEGVEQIIRKKNFVEKNPELFAKHGINIKNKRIIPFVLTSTSNFTGWIVNDIPVLDYMLLNNYIDVGCLVVGNLSNSEFNEKNKILYYTNQQEFETNFYNFIHDPLPIKDISNIFTKQYKKIISNDRIFKAVNPKGFIEVYENTAK